MTLNWRSLKAQVIAPSTKGITPSRTCLFIAGERPYGNDPWCGAPVQEGSVYCPEHHARCYTGKPEPKPRKSARDVDGRSFE